MPLRPLLLFICFTGIFALPTWALQPDQILLVANKNSDDSLKLANLYASLRHIPDGRIVTLDLPRDEEMEFDTYERDVVPPIRQFLIDHNLKTKVNCLVTFYGVPFRIRARHNSDADIKELADLQEQRKKAVPDLAKAVDDIEKQALALDPTFTHSVNDDLGSLVERAQTALNICGIKIGLMGTAEEKAQASAPYMQVLATLGGVAEIDTRYGPQQRSTRHPTQKQDDEWIDLHNRIQATTARTQELQARRYDPAARAELIKIVRENYGLVGYSEVLQAQILYFDTKETNSATDNELALLWWNAYPRARWYINPLHYKAHVKTPPVEMVMRLDAPNPAIVEKMIRTSIDIEKSGLQGGVALDARGIRPMDEKGKLDPYGEYDQHIRNLNDVLHAKTNLRVVLDNKPAVFAPGSVEDVALYCGWYSLSHYVPGMKFNAGAVGYHIASGELENLHGDKPTEWVHGLLTDGVVATLGPVAEPYLSSFPLPDDFFPLLLTGRLTMAEVYWKTTPATSWMIGFIGDPLYTPYKVNPAMKVQDLTPEQQRIFSTPATEPLDSSHQIR